MRKKKLWLFIIKNVDVLKVKKIGIFLFEFYMNFLRQKFFFWFFLVNFFFVFVR